MENGVQREDLSILDIVANLPTEVAPWRQDTNTFLDNLRLSLKIGLKPRPALIFLSKVVRRRSDDELYPLGGNGPQQVKAIPGKHNDFFSRIE
jgi:hypothetical protein